MYPHTSLKKIQIVSHLWLYRPTRSKVLVHFNLLVQHSVLVLHKFLSPLAHLGKQSTNFMKNTCPNYILTCPSRKRAILCIESCMPTMHFQLAKFGQLLFLGLSKCQPVSDFHLPQAIRQVLMQHPGPAYTVEPRYKEVGYLKKTLITR